MTSNPNYSGSEVQAGASASGARAVHRWLAALLVAGTVVEFFLAGLGVFRTENTASRSGASLTTSEFNHDFEAHIVLGSVVAVISVALVVAALVGRYRGRRLLVSVSLLVVVAVQAALADSGPYAVRALHPLLGVAIVAMGVYIVRLVGWPWSPPGAKDEIVDG